MAFTLGYTIGTLIGTLQEKFGRLFFIKLGLIMTTLAGSLVAAMPEIYSLAVVSLIAGTGVGTFEFAWLTYATEINTIENRARFFMQSWYGFYAGNIACNVLAIFLTPKLKPKHWRVLI
jgi:MFS family permease